MDHVQGATVVRFGAAAMKQTKTGILKGAGKGLGLTQWAFACRRTQLPVFPKL